LLTVRNGLASDWLGNYLVGGLIDKFPNRQSAAFRTACECLIFRKPVPVSAALRKIQPVLEGIHSGLHRSLLFSVRALARIGSPGTAGRLPWSGNRTELAERSKLRQSLEAGDVEEALRAAGMIGADRLQMQS
jgi:hypothetical protein